MAKNIYTLLFLLISAATLSAQVYTFNSSINNTTITTCSGTFLDSGGAGSNYGNNESFTVTFVPSIPTQAVRIDFVINAFDVQPGDVLQIFDGPDATFPSYGSFDNTVTPNAYYIPSNINPNGSLTIVFTSNGSGTGSGFQAAFRCTSPCQSFTASIVNTVPARDANGYLNLCIGDSVTFTANALFPNNGALYSQSIATSTFTWIMDDGTTVSGLGRTTFGYRFNTRRGYKLRLIVKDNNDCFSSNYIEQKIRVAQKPVFTSNITGTTGCSNDTFTVQVGASGSAGGSFGASTTYGNFLPPTTSGDSIFLPDRASGGAGASCYDTQIQVGGLTPGRTIQSVNDIVSMCMTIEHSFSGDLSFFLIAPNGVSVTLFPYTNIGGSNYFGYPVDDGTCPNSNLPGLGLQYCFSNSMNTTATRTLNSPAPIPTIPISWTTPCGAIQAGSAITAGTYFPENSFNAFIGCPANGTWTLRICDNQFIDNGFIFNWSMQFAPNLYPNPETYTNSIVSQRFITPNPIIVGQSGNSVQVSSPNPGPATVRYEVTDSFGCVYDTAIVVTFLPGTDPRCISCDTFRVTRSIDTTLCANGGVATLRARAPRFGPPSFSFNNATQRTINKPTIAGTSDTTRIVIPVSGVIPVILGTTALQSVNLNISQNRPGHLIINLVSPSGQRVTLSSRHGGNSNTAGFVNTTFISSATTPITTYVLANIPANQSVRPFQAFTGFATGQANGNWTLEIIHTNNGGFNGTFQNVTLNFENTLTPQYTWRQITPTPPPLTLSSTNTSVTNATPTVSSLYEVVAYNQFCRDSARINVFVDNQLPAPQVTCLAISSSDIVFNWPTVAGAQGYSISVNGGAAQNIGNVTSYTATGLTIGQSVTLNVIAIAGPGACGNSSAGTATCSTSGCTAPTITVSNGGPVCPGQTIGLTANVASGVSVSWSGPNSFTSTSTNPTRINATLAMAGTYRAIATEPGGCTASAVTNVTVNSTPNPSVTASGSTAFCSGISRVLTAAGANTYLWSNGATGNNITVNTAGTWTVTATDTNSCTATTSIVTSVNPNPTVTVSNNGPICFGASVTMTAQTTSAATYNWSGPLGYTSAIPNPSIANSNGNTGGTYDVTVTDTNGCSVTGTTNVIVQTLPNVGASNTGPYCLGSNIQLNAIGGISYSWRGPAGYSSTGASPAPIVNANLGQAGTYVVTATDINGCTGTASTSVTVASQLVPVVSNNGPVCPGINVTLTAQGGTNFSWSGPNGFTSTTQNPVLNAPTSGTYRITVSDAAGCTGTGSTNVVVNSIPTISASNTGPYCVGATIQLNAVGAGGFSWSGPNGYSSTASNPQLASAAILQAGTYIVTITNANGCTNTASTNVVVNSNLTINIAPSGATTFCQGTTLVLTATGGTNYTWSNGAVSTSTTANNSGTISVQASDANGCTGTASIVLTQVPTPTVTCGNTGPFCPSTPIQLNASSNATSFAWSGPAAFSSALQNPSINNATSGNGGVYTVVISVAPGCTASASTTVQILPSPTISVTNSSPVCEGGSISFNTVPNVGSFSWSGPNGFINFSPNPIIAIAGAAEQGVYTVTYTDTNGCSTTGNSTAIVNLNPIISAFNDGPYCPGDTIILAATGANSFVWSGPNSYSGTGDTTRIQSANLGMNGTYTVIATDVFGCIGTASTNVTVNNNPVVSFTNDGPYCPGAQITLTLTGGASYELTYPDGTTVPSSPPSVILSSASATDAGTYSMTATDANGCTNSASTLIVVRPEGTGTATNTGPYCQGQSANFNVTVTGGIGANYNWSGPNGFTSNQQAPFLANLTTSSAGVYTVSFTDLNGCAGTASTTLVVNPTPIPVITTSNGRLEFCGGTSIGLIAGGVANPVIYAWSNGLGSNPTATATASGSYSVTITDNAVCVGVGSIIVDALPPVTFSVITDSVSCNGGNDGSARVSTVTGGTGNYTSFVWSNGQSGTNNLLALTAGSYAVTVTDDLGCFGTRSFSIGEPSVPLLSIATKTDPTCFDTDNGVGIVNPSGGSAPYFYNWSNGATTQNTNNLAADIRYYVTVTDARGCQHIDSLFLNEPAAVSLTIINIVGATCFGSRDGQATVIGSGGTPYPTGEPYTYQWASGESTPSASALRPGLQGVTIADANGCLRTDTLRISSPSELIITVTATTRPLCAGTGTGSITVDGRGGNPPYSFQWDVTAGSQTSSTATNVPAGTYSVTMTDGNGCNAVRTVTLLPTALLLDTIRLTNPVLCNGETNGALEVNVGGGNAPYTYAWSNGMVGDSITGLAADIYTLTLTDANGCTNVDSYSITEPAAIAPNFANVDPRCFYTANGEIILLPTGGRAPYQYALGIPTNFKPARIFSGLLGGAYDVIIKDANGCTATFPTTLTQPAVFTVTTTPSSTSMEFGTSATINVTTNAVGPTFVWAPSETLNCSVCQTVVATPTFTTVYTVSVIDAAGCVVTDTVEVDLTVARRVYIPNLFSPNGDGNNDTFRPECGFGVEKINYFRVYDRWGEKVYELLNADVTSNAHQGWNGRYNGQLMNSQVFGWHAEIRYTDGKVEVLRGEVTLMR